MKLFYLFFIDKYNCWAFPSKKCDALSPGKQLWCRACNTILQYQILLNAIIYIEMKKSRKLFTSSHGM